MTSRRGKPLSRRGLEQRVLRRWRGLDQAAGASIVVGFSGGPDSLALAACLARLCPLLNAQVRLFHVDHGLRPTSSREADHARELAAEMGLECEVARIDARSLSTHLGVGVEEGARRERYRLFASVVANNDNAIVALAHHEMDQAETVLLHLLRGSGVHGAAGMSDFSAIRVPWWQECRETHPIRLRLWRPLLLESRDVVRNYVREIGLTPVQDESNELVEFRRNAIRHNLLPTMEQLVPGATSAMARFAALAAEDDQYLIEKAERIYIRARSGGEGLSIGELLRAPLALRRRAIMRWLTEFAEIEPTQDRIEAIVQLIERRRHGPAIEIGRNYVATISDDRERLVIHHR